MKLSPIMRRSLVAVLAGGYYCAVIYLTGLHAQLTSMRQYFGHALIYASGVALISSGLFIGERLAQKRKEHDLWAESMGPIRKSDDKV